MFAKFLRIKQCQFLFSSWSLLYGLHLIPVRRWPKPNLNGKPATNVYGSLLEQFSKGTLIYLTKQIWEQESNLAYFTCEGVKSAGQIFCNNIINTGSTFGPLGFGRLSVTQSGLLRNIPCGTQTPHPRKIDYFVLRSLGGSVCKIKRITWGGALRGSLAVKLDSCNNLPSSAHTMSVIHSADLSVWN